MNLKVKKIFYLFLLFLPFTQALTINVGFPLKISELMIISLVFLYLGGLRVSLKRLDRFFSNYWLLLFLIAAICSFFVNAFWNYSYGLKIVPLRIGQKGDSFLRLGYVILNISAFFLSIKFLSMNKVREKALKLWMYGAIFAACYSWYLFVSSALELPYLKLIGMESIPQNINGIIRCGTFKEGNFFGLYLILSSAIAFNENSKRIGWFLMLSVLSSMSTISLISGIFYLIYIFRHDLINGKILYVYPIIFIFSLFFSQTVFFKRNIQEKIFQPVENLTPSNLSKVDRFITGRIAFNEGLDNPFFGVGPYNYGLHYDHYNDYHNVVSNPTPWFDNFINRKNKRAITNNVYLEVFSEYGIFGFLFFVLFLVRTLMVSIKMKSDYITGGILSLLISFIAFPSFIMLFIWVFLAIPYAMRYDNKT